MSVALWFVPAILTEVFQLFSLSPSCWLSCQVEVLYQYWNTLLIDRWVLTWVGHSQATLDGRAFTKSDLHVARDQECYYVMQLKFDKIVHSKAYQL